MGVGKDYPGTRERCVLLKLSGGELSHFRSKIRGSTHVASYGRGGPRQKVDFVKCFDGAIIL